MPVEDQGLKFYFLHHLYSGRCLMYNVCVPYILACIPNNINLSLFIVDFVMVLAVCLSVILSVCLLVLYCQPSSLSTVQVRYYGLLLGLS